MKIVCNRDFKNWDGELTYGKVYDILPKQESVKSFPIINDKGQEQYYFKFMFVTLEEWRDKQLNKLL